MLTERDGRVTPVLIDFNTATGFDASGEAEDSGTTILGPYKPREVADASRSEARQGPWSDVYSIGKILLFLLKGTVPKMDGVDPRDFGVDCPPYLAEIVERATATSYEDRYHNATAMEHVLREMDPTPPPQASVRYLQEADRYTIHVGDTIGREDAVGPRPPSPSRTKTSTSLPSRSSSTSTTTATGSYATGVSTGRTSRPATAGNASSARRAASACASRTRIRRTATATSRRPPSASRTATSSRSRPPQLRGHLRVPPALNHALRYSLRRR